MKVAIMVEGKTEKAFMPCLRTFLTSRVEQMPKLVPIPYDGRIPKKNKLKRDVERLLTDYDAVIALTDVYTGSREFQNAAKVKEQMRNWVGEDSRFYPHAAQHDFEAWLLPFWSDIQKLAKHNKSAPSGLPEDVNHDKPPSEYIKEIFNLGKHRSYSKTRDALKILANKDLLNAAKVCPELKAFLNTLLSLCEGELIP